VARSNTGMGADVFFQTEVRPIRQNVKHEPSRLEGALSKAERRSFNLKPSILSLLDEIQIKTMRNGDKWTLSAIVERGIELVAAEKGIQEPANSRASE
jgi:hypothetical protein